MALRHREQPLAFASFRLLRDQKVLLEKGVPVRIGSRALDLLIALVERAGEVVGKNELIASAWPESVVEENNLRVHMSAIRKLLGDGEPGARFIINVPGRGYSFVAPVSREEDSAAVPTVAADPLSPLPIALTRVVGREAIVGAIAELFSHHRLLTVYGAGGIGKTTVSLAVADRMLGFGNRVCFIDLAEATDSRQIALTIATALGGQASPEDPLAVLAAYLQQARLILLLDNCEHVIGAVAQIVERLLHSAPELRILATSRERLLADGEHAIQLPPLPCPDAAAYPTPEQALCFPAVELFVERARAAHDGFTLTDQNVATVAALCRRLDGIPLALELVAARASLLDLKVLLSSIDQDLLGISGGRRTSGRHQSLNATLDWSFRLLSPSKQIILRRLSVFHGLFSVATAQAVVSDESLDSEAVSEGLMGLLQRSLLVADTTGAKIRYRLLNVTRAYAQSRLVESGEAEMMARRHAQQHCADLENAVSKWETLSRAAWIRGLPMEIADLRASVEWSFGPGGESSLAARLFVASLPIGISLSLEKFVARALQTIEVLRVQPEQDLVALLRVQCAILAAMVQSGATLVGIRERMEAAVELAHQVGVASLMTEALLGQAVICLEWAEYTLAVQRFESLEAVAKRADDPIAVLLADRLGAQVFHWAGDQGKARLRAERVLRQPPAPVPLAYGQSPVDRQVSMRIILARIAWLEGRADDARELAIEAVAAASANAPVDIAQALGFASCPIALWRGDREEARGLVSRLLEHSRRHGFQRWYRLAQRYQHCLDATPPHFDSNDNISALERDLLATLNMHWVEEESIARAEAGQAGWCNAELLRVAGEKALLRCDARATATADILFRTALEYARGSGTLAWELRCATSLARLCAQKGERDTAIGLLTVTCARFAQGFTTSDYQCADQLLRRLQAQQ